jgi:transcriptional regulator NrdR family protein
MNEIVRSLEEEKIARNSIQSTLIKLKEDFARGELDKDKMIIDLQTKYDKARIEKQQIELEINKQKEAHIRSDQVNQNKIATLEDQLSRALSMYAELDESSKIVIDKLKKENGSSNTDVAKKFE